MTELIPFNFDSAAVRVVLDEYKQPWFVAKDVCEVLGVSNVSVAVERLDDDERSKFNLGRQGYVNIVSESGLYALVFTSRKPEAKRFRRWVTSEVLPALRQTGQYQVQSEPQALPIDVRHLKPTLRATAMNTAVQVVKQCGGDEADVDRLYAKYCTMLAPAALSKALQESNSEWEAMIQNWADAALTPDTQSRKQAAILYGLFRKWARGDGYEGDLPSMRFWGSRMQERFTKAKIGGLCWYFVDLKEMA